MNGLPSYSTEIEAQAVHWLGLHDSGDLTPEQEREFHSWLQAHADHAAAFAALSEMWAGFDDARKLAPAGEPDPTLLAPKQAMVIRPHRSIWKRVLPPAAAAALIAVGFFVWQGIDARQPYAAFVSTAVGAQQTQTLPDGSVLKLNTNTSLAVDFTAAERRIRLGKGEAHFTVAHDPSRPFIVSVGKVSVLAVGTAFNIRFEPKSIEILVTEGKVRVDDTATGGTLLPESAAQISLGQLNPEPVLEAGKRVVIPVAVPADLKPPALVVDNVAAPALQRALAWQEQRLEFDLVPLEQIVAEFNRYNRHQIVVEGEFLKAQRFGGKFRPDGYDALVRLLRSSFGVQVEERGDETILRLPDAPSPSR